MVAMTLAPSPAGPCQNTLPSLADALPKQPWLQRSLGDGETEEVTLLEGPEGPARSSRAYLRSLTSEQLTGAPAASGVPSQIVFKNESARTVRCLWLDFKGGEVPYSTLEPGQSSNYSSWSAHAWVVREIEGARRMCINGTQALIAAPGMQTACITDPPRLIWQEGTHRGFSSEFRSAARTLMLSWQRLGTQGSGGPGGAAAAGLGNLPFDLVRLLIEQLAPTGVWQEGRAVSHPGIQPVLLHNQRAFQLLVEESCGGCGGRLPPPPCRTSDELQLAVAPPAPRIVLVPAQPPAQQGGAAQAVHAVGAFIGNLLGA